MICRKCGAELSEDAVFCDKCGSFVMRGERMPAEPVETAGKRRRSRSSFWVFFRPAALIIIIAAGIAACIFSYIQVQRDRNRKMYGQPYAPRATAEASVDPTAEKSAD